MIRKISLALAIFTFTYLQTCGQSLQQKMDSIVTSKMEAYEIPGLAIGIVHQDTLVYTAGYGVANIDTEKRVTPKTVFHTASISKLFTAQAITYLVDEGRISYDDKLIDLAPELNFENDLAKSIRVIDLLNHTSGLPDVWDYDWGNDDISTSALAKYVRDLDLKSSTEPGTKYRYSNLAYEILGYLIEKTSGANFDEFLKEHILSPAGMTVSDFRYFEIPESLRTSPHTSLAFIKPVVGSTYPYNRAHAPSSTLNASAAELSQWMIHFMKRNDAFTKEALPGFQHYDLKDFQAIGHFGGDKGFRSLIMMVPDRKIGVIVLGNCDYNEDFRQEIAVPLTRLMMGL